MTMEERIRVRKIIRTLARRDGVPSEEVRQQIQQSIDDAWATQDLAVRRKQLQLVPDGKPTPEEFIIRVSKQI